MIAFALTNHGAWGIALIIGLVAALAVAALLVVLISADHDIGARPAALLEVAGRGRRQHREHPAAAGDRAGARADRGRGRRPGRLHERAHRRIRGGGRGQGERRMSQTTLIILSVMLAVVVIAVLAAR